MPSESAASALFDIRDNIILAQAFVRGLDYKGFKASRLHFYAATRALEIVSEASRRLPEDIHRHPHLPWRAIRDSGNVYRHGYDNVAEALVWDTIQQHLSPLLIAIVAEIDRHNAAP